MSDAYQGASWHFGDKTIKPLLGLFVESRRRLIEEQPLRPDEKRASKGQTLLLARRELHRPVLGLVKTPAKLFEAAQAERVADIRVAMTRRRFPDIAPLAAKRRAADKVFEGRTGASGPQA